MRRRRTHKHEILYEMHVSAETRTAVGGHELIGVEVGEDGVAQLPASFSTYISPVLQESQGSVTAALRP